MSREVGHRTTFANKSLVIGSLADAITSHSIIFHSKQTVEELRHYTRKDGGSPEVGYHDDEVMTAALAVHAARAYPHRLKPYDAYRATQEVFNSQYNRDHPDNASQRGYQNW